MFYSDDQAEDEQPSPTSANFRKPVNDTHHSMNQTDVSLEDQELRKKSTITYLKSKQEKQASWDYDQKRLTRWQELRKNVYGYSLMLWDGLGFFGTDHMKLGRLKGEKVDFCTPFKSPRTAAISLLGAIFAIYIVLTEIQYLGTQKSQTLSMI